ncbi:MAG TPA: DinB family protein [Chitinophagaceae bacterium]|nr:DinB family protein [Chitinophagaceae bacterium]
MKKLILRIAFCLPVFTFVFFNESPAQSLEDIKTQMLKDWERAKVYTVDYLNTMPADKYSFRATDSIRSFAQQMLHLAQANLFLMSNATEQQPPSWLMSNPEKRSTAQQKDSVMYYVVSSYDYCNDAVKSLDVSKWSEKKKLFKFEETRFALMNKTFEHQGHHRGQTTVYMRLQGIKPPEERLF